MKPMPADEDDAQLVAEAQAGDRRAMDLLLRQHQPAIYTLCRRIAGNDADALDATQEALIAVVRGLDRFDGRSKVSTWVYRVATNACLDELRRRSRRPVVGLPGIPDTDHAGAWSAPSGADPVADSVADRVVIDAALAGLSPDFRAAVVLRDLLDLDYAEIATVLDLPPGTVRSRIARGRRHLADQIAGNQIDSLERPTSQP